MTASIPKFPTYFVSLSSLSLFEYSGGQHKVRIKFLPGAHNMQSLERLGTIRQINHYTYFKLQQPKQILHCRNRFAGLFSSFLKYQYYSRHLASLLKEQNPHKPHPVARINFHRDKPAQMLPPAIPCLHSSHRHRPLGKQRQHRHSNTPVVHTRALQQQQLTPVLSSPVA